MIYANDKRNRRRAEATDTALGLGTHTETNRQIDNASCVAVTLHWQLLSYFRAISATVK